MLELLSPKELQMKPKGHDDTLSGQITVYNSSKNCYMPFKIKATKPALFLAQPSQAIVDPGKKQVIRISTIDSIDKQMAKQLALNHKFLIEFAIVNYPPTSLEEGIRKIHQASAQQFKVSINTDSVRRGDMKNSRTRSYQRQHSVRSAVSNNNSAFKSIINSPSKNTNYNSARKFMSNQLTPSSTVQNYHSNELQELNNKIHELTQIRNQLFLSNNIKKNGSISSGFWKKIIVLVMGVLIGNYAAKQSGATQFINENLIVNEDIKYEANYENSQSWWSWGEQEPQKKQQQSWF